METLVILARVSVRAAQLRAWAPGSLAGVAVVAFAAGSSSLSSVKHLGHTARWVALFALCVVALIEALPLARRPVSRELRRFLWLTASFVGLCFLSTAWSPASRLTFERTASLTILFITGLALSLVVSADTAGLRRLLTGLAGGAAVVALVGFAMLAVGAKAAAQKATEQTPWRYRGFGENPNTVAVLAAVALPIVAWLYFTARGKSVRLLWTGTSVALLGSTVLTGSRGGQIAALLGVEVVILTMAPRSARRVALGVGYAAVLLAGIAVREVTQPSAPSFYSAVAKPPASALAGAPPATVTKAAGAKRGRQGGTYVSPTSSTLPPHIAIRNGAPLQPLPPRESEIGHPWLSRKGTTTVGSGRVAVWEGTLRDVVLERPLLGYGFGTEERVFVDRWYNFQGGTSENSVIGLLLQVGIVGLLLIVALVGVVVCGAVRVIRRAQADRTIAGVGLGVIVSGLVLALFQAYVYSVGDVATMTVWVIIFVTAASTLSAGDETRGGAR